MFGGTAAKAKNENNQQQEHNIFFEGGEIEFGIEFEGGSDEETNKTEGFDEGAETIKSKRSKKKAKKKRATSSIRGSNIGFNDHQ